MKNRSKCSPFLSLCLLAGGLIAVILPKGFSQEKLFAQSISADPIGGLVETLKSHDWTKRVLAVRALRDFRDLRAVAALDAILLADPDPLVRSAAAGALSDLADRAYSIRSVDPATGQPVDWDQVDQVQRVSIHSLVVALSNSDPVVRNIAAGAFRMSYMCCRMRTMAMERQALAIIDELVMLLDDERQVVRVAAANELGSLLSNFSGKVKATKAQAGGFTRLTRDLDNPNVLVRCEVGFGLGSGYLGGYLQVDKRLKVAAKAAEREACGVGKQWSSTVEANTSAAYQRFLAKYPSGVLAEEARRRADDPAHAFLATFQMAQERRRDSKDQLKILEGYLKSYPDSAYAPVARQYFEFLKEAGKYFDFHSLKRFLPTHPDNWFAVAARLSSPLLMLKDANARLGVVITITRLENRGLLGGGVGNMEKKRQELWPKLGEQLTAEGISAVLLEAPGVKPTEGEIQYQLAVEYSEGAPIRAPYYGSPDPASVLAHEAAANLSNIFWRNVPAYTRMVLTDARDGSYVFPAFSNLSWTTSLDEDIVLRLRRDSEDTCSALMRFLLTLSHVDLADPEQREAAKSSLESLIGRGCRVGERSVFVHERREVLVNVH